MQHRTLARGPNKSYKNVAEQPQQQMALVPRRSKVRAHLLKSAAIRVHLTAAAVTRRRSTALMPPACVSGALHRILLRSYRLISSGLQRHCAHDLAAASGHRVRQPAHHAACCNVDSAQRNVRPHFGKTAAAAAAAAASVAADAELRLPLILHSGIIT